MNVDDDLDATMRDLASEAPARAAIATTAREPVHRRRRIRRVALSLTIVLAVAGIVTIAALVSARLPDSIRSGAGPQAPMASDVARGSVGTEEVPSSSARCYASANLHRTDNYLAFSIGSQSSVQAPAGPEALEICRQKWAEGTLTGFPPYVNDSPVETGQRILPPLVACVLPSALSDENSPEVVVFPGSPSTCTDLDLARYRG